VISICRLVRPARWKPACRIPPKSLLAGNGWMMSGLKTGILLSFLAARFHPSAVVPIFVARRIPRALQPFQLFHLRFIRSNASSATSAAAAARWA